MAMFALDRAMSKVAFSPTLASVVDDPRSRRAERRRAEHEAMFNHCSEVIARTVRE